MVSCNITSIAFTFVKLYITTQILTGLILVNTLVKGDGDTEGLSEKDKNSQLLFITVLSSNIS